MVRVVFIGYQYDGEKNYYPIFNIDEPGHPLDECTFSLAGLAERGINAAPQFPTFQEWKKQKGKKYRGYFKKLQGKV